MDFKFFQSTLKILLINLGFANLSQVYISYDIKEAEQKEHPCIFEQNI